MSATTLSNKLDSLFDTANITSGDIAAIGTDEPEAREQNPVPRRAVLTRHTTAHAETKRFPYIPPEADLDNNSYFAQDCWTIADNFLPGISTAYLGILGVGDISSKRVDAMENIVIVNGPQESTPSQNPLIHAFTKSAGLSLISLSNDYSYEHYIELSKSQENTRVSWLITKFRKSDNIRDDYKERLIQRICELRDLGIEDNEPMASSSLSNFYNFMIQNQDIGHPSLALSSAGHIVALWYESDQQRLSIEFLPGNKVAYVVFARDPKSTAICKASGNLSTQSVLDHLSYFNMKEWLRRYVLE